MPRRVEQLSLGKAMGVLHAVLVVIIRVLFTKISSLGTANSQASDGFAGQ